MTKLKIIKVGNSAAIILPKSVLERFDVVVGEELHIVETQNGIELTPYDPEFEAQMKLAREVMKRRRDVLRELAK